MGASDKIFDHFIFLSSVPTIPIIESAQIAMESIYSVKDKPFNLVPIGSPALLIKTQALSSNLTTLPSGLCNFLTVLTTTACLRSPLRTLLAAEVETLAPGPDSGPKFLCFCTTTIMRSPGTGINYKLRSLLRVETNQSLRASSFS